MLLSLPVLELRKMVDEDAPREHLQAKPIAQKYDVDVSFTPPHVGKWMSGVERKWSIEKTRYRGTPSSQRGSPTACISLVRGISKNIMKERLLLLRLFLPSWRWVLAALAATFHGKRLLYKSKRLLLPEVHEALIDYANRLRSGEAGELEDDAPLIDIAAPPALAYAALRLKGLAEGETDEVEPEEAVRREAAVEPGIWEITWRRFRKVFVSVS